MPWQAVELDWHHAGKAKDLEEKGSAGVKREASAVGRAERNADGSTERRGPAWMRDEGADAPSADGMSLAERRRADFEAERKAMQVVFPLAFLPKAVAQTCDPKSKGQ